MDFTYHAPREYIGVHSNVPRACKNAGRNCLFLLLCWVKPALLAQIQVENLTINNSLPHSEFHVQNYGCSRGRQLWNFLRVSIFSLIFQGMFLSLAICFQLPCGTKPFQVRVLIWTSVYFCWIFILFNFVYILFIFCSILSFIREQFIFVIGAILDQVLRL